MNGAPFVEFENVYKTYKRWSGRPRTVEAVCGVSFFIQPGEIFALMGPNRAGKTTLIKMLLSLSKPTTGVVKRFNEPVKKRETLQRVGYVHENQAFPRYLTASTLLCYYASLGFVDPLVVRKKGPELLERVGLSNRSSEPISDFSKGMVQRLALAQALISDPDLLVLDEPTEGLDVHGRAMVHELIRERKQQGKSVLLVSHVLSDVEQLADRIGVIVNGKLSYLGAMNAFVNDGTGKTKTLIESLQPLYAEQRL